MSLRVIKEGCPERTKGRPCCMHHVEMEGEEEAGVSVRQCCWCGGGIISRPPEKHGPYRWRHPNDSPAKGARVRR